MTDPDLINKVVEITLRDRSRDEAYVLEGVSIENVLGRFWLYGVIAHAQNMIQPGVRTMVAISDITTIRIYDSVGQYDRSIRAGWKRLDKKCGSCGNLPDHCQECGHCMQGYGD